jgi:hypothetical protein
MSKEVLKEVKKIAGQDAWLVDGRVVMESTLSEAELKDIRAKSSGEVSPIMGGNKEIVGVQPLL